MIIEDSPTVRELLVEIIAQDPRLEVAACTASAEEGLARLAEVQPDVISMDIRLPGMNGFEATSLVMARQPTPVVVVSASVDSDELNITMNALRAGALTVIEKPTGITAGHYQALARRLCDQLVIMSEVKVVRQRIRRDVRLPGAPSAAARPPSLQGELQVVALAASTGGPGALVTLLNRLPADFPLPVLLVQHICAPFLRGFVNWLDRCVPQQVMPAEQGVVPRGGTVYVAPAELHLQMGEHSLRLVQAPPLNSQRPSATLLFRSLAANAGPRAVGVLLTGMGDDGAEGLLELRQAGGYTLAEDASTAVVFGMPAAAVALGAATEVLPLPRIADRLLELVAPSSGVRR